MLFHKIMNNYLLFQCFLSVMIPKVLKKPAGFGDFPQNQLETK